MSLRRWVARNLDWLARHRLNTGGYFYGDMHLISGGAKLAERWDDVARLADFRPSDRVLDVGCAEGLISLEVARQVTHVDAIDIDGNRIRRARVEASKRKITNASFDVGSIVDWPVDSSKYDVILFLNVLSNRSSAGIGELEKLLKGARRQIIVRANVQKYREKKAELKDILVCMDNHGFDSICFSGHPGRGNLILGHRRGTDARLRCVPPLVLIPTTHLRGHPCLQGAQIGSYSDFA